MKGLFKRAMPMGVIIGAVSLLFPTSAYAASVGTFETVLTGSGTISPGLTMTATPQTFSVSATATDCGWDSSGASTGCSWPNNAAISGSSTPADTLISGAGTASVSLSGSGLAVFAGACGVQTSATLTGNGQINYTRVGSLVVVSVQPGFTVQVNGGSCVNFNATAGAGVFVFVPTSAPGAPVTSFTLAGAATMVDAHV